MDETVPFGIPYPQCEPPLTKDAADIQHLQTMALGIDAAVQSVATPADDNWISPDAAYMFGDTATTIFAGDEIDFSTTAFDNAGIAEPANNRFVIRQSGFYDVSCMLFGTPTAAPTVDIGIRISVNSVVGEIRGNSLTTNIDAGTTFLAQRRFNEGDQVVFIYDGVFDYDVISTRAGIFKIV